MLLQMIEQIGREKNIEPSVIVDAVEEAMAVAAQKFYRTEDYLVAKLDPESGEVNLHAVKKVVDEVEDPLSEITVAQAIEAGMVDPQVGDELRTEMPTDQLGRIAAQAAKQVIYQKVRDAERDNIYAEYIDRVGEILTGSVKRFERGDMVVDFGRVEAIMPRREQSRAEHYNIGDRIRVVIVDVLRATRGPQIVVSRSSAELLKRLFEMEVPEIYDGTVLIKGAVREGGDRAKVAVHSIDPDVDPVGACVGMRGSRVQAIIRELRGEKIDIVQWADEEHQFAINSLKPARVKSVKEVVKTDDEGEEEEHLEVLVDEDQLSLAIGKRGQNVRLAGRLLGRKIDVVGTGVPVRVTPATEREEEDIGEVTIPGMAAIEGIGPKAANALHEAGYRDAAGIVDGGTDALLAVAGLGPKSALKVYDAAVAAIASEAVADIASGSIAEPQPDVAADDESGDDGSSSDETEGEAERPTE